VLIGQKCDSKKAGGTMRLSELAGKEVINVVTGNRLGVIQKSDFLVNTKTGQVEALILMKQSWIGRETEITTIPWRDIKKISDELIIISGAEHETKF
jgi:YlmC/YmxH family sporulation protein